MADGKRRAQRRGLLSVAALLSVIATSDAQAQTPAILKCEMQPDGLVRYYRIASGAWAEWNEPRQQWVAKSCDLPGRVCTVNDAYYLYESTRSNGGSSIQINRSSGEATLEYETAGQVSIYNGVCARSTDPALIPRRPVL